jgi:hypothetical protein
VDDHVWAHLVEDGLQLGRVGDVGLVVGHPIEAVAVAAEVDRGDLGGPLVQRELDDVVAEKAVAADD